MSALDEILSHAALPERTIDLCLRGDLVARMQDLEAELVAAREASKSIEDTAPRRLAEQIEALRAEMKSATVTFRLRGLPRRTWADLVATHEPDPKQSGHRALGYNPHTLFPALAKACIVDPALTDEQWDRLEGALSAGQFDELANAALAVTRREVDVPFSLAASATLASSDET
jgi:hypothetical protein